MPGSQIHVGHYAPGFKLAVNGSELEPAAASSVLKVQVEQELNKTNSFTLEVQDEFRAGHFHWLEADLLRIGDTVSISIGYTQSLVRILEGRIKNLNASFHTGCAPILAIEGTDMAYDLLTTPSETRVFSEKHDSDIVREIARMGELDPDVEETEAVSAVKIKAGGKSYLEFLKRLATENNYEFFLGGRRLYFRLHSYRDSVATLGWGKNIIRFAPQLNTTAAITEVIVRAWDAKGKKPIEGRASAGDEVIQESRKQTSSQWTRTLFGDAVRVITDRPVRSVEEAQRIARSELNSASNHLVQATIETIGNPELIPGVCVDIEGFGTMFSGKYYIFKAAHTLNREGYRTSLTVRRNAV